MRGRFSCAMAAPRRSGASSGSSRPTQASASCDMRTQGTRTRCGSPRPTGFGRRCGSDPLGHPSVAVDGVLIREGGLVTVIRGNPPYLGMHALPGGHVELGETMEAAMLREFHEETGLRAEVERIVGVYSDPTRDPRGHTVSVAYSLRETGGTLPARSDAAGVDLLGPHPLAPMAVGHATIVPGEL